MNRSDGWRRAALTVLVATAAGCADGSMTEPTQSEPTPQHLLGLIDLAPDISVLARFEANALTSLLNFGYAARWIGPQGGSVRLQDFEIVVPPGAVSSYRVFSIKLPLNLGLLNRAYAEFGPHNVPFEVPVQLRMPYTATSASGKLPSIVWWNGKTWVRYKTSLLPDGRIETTTDHFSEFGTEENPERGITPVGG